MIDYIYIFNNIFDKIKNIKNLIKKQKFFNLYIKKRIKYN